MKNENIKNKKDKATKDSKETKASNGIDELKNQIKNLRDELFNLKLEHEQRKLKNTSLLTFKRKEIARLLTTLRIMELTQ